MLICQAECCLLSGWPDSTPALELLSRLADNTLCALANNFTVDPFIVQNDRVRCWLRLHA